MSIFDRVRMLVKSSVHDALDRVEDPGRILRQRVRELDATVNEARQALADFAVPLKKLEKEEEQLKRLRDEWGHKSLQALKGGDEDTARLGLGEKQKVESRLETLVPSLEKSRKTYAEMRDALVSLQDQLRDAKLKQTELESRDKSAAAQRTFSEKLQKAGGGAAGNEFDRMEDKVLNAEAMVEIQREVDRDLPGAAALERKTKSLSVEAELAAMKKQLGKS